MERMTSYERYSCIRNARHMTDYEVSKRTGINPSTFTHWKHGDFKPKVEKLLMIADVLECPLEALLGIKPRYGYED